VLAYGARDMPVERRVTIGERQRRRDRFDVDDWNLIGRWDRLDGDAAVYERDDRGRLTAVINKNVADETTGVHRWGYDASGDRVVSAFGKTAAYCAFDAHRPITCGGEHLVYDRRGRVIRRIDAELRVTEFHWNSVNQLRRVDLPDGVWFEYDYDVLGRRVAKRRGDVRSGETTVARFEWIDNHLVHECTFDGDAPRHRHYLYHPRSFAPLACISGGEDGWRVNSVTTDLRGAPIAVFSPGGEELWAADVLPFGEREVRRESEEMPLVLPGQYADAETGLLYNNARYYNPSTATYLTPDLIGLAGGDNPYQYVTDPLSEIDPLGLNPEQIALGLSTYRMPLPNGKSAVVPDVLTRFAADPAGDGSVRAGTWTSFDPVEDPDTGLNDFGASIKKAMHDAKTIHFNLEGMGNDPNRASVADILSNPDPSRYKPPSTEWELATVLSDPELRKKTVFYDRPGVESKQIPCIT
jgi:RHS repeat-associated protein